MELKRFDISAKKFTNGYAKILWNKIAASLEKLPQEGKDIAIKAKERIDEILMLGDLVPQAYRIVARYMSLIGFGNVKLISQIHDSFNVDFIIFGRMPKRSK